KQCVYLLRPDGEVPTLLHQVFDLVECLEQPHLRRGVVFSLDKLSAVSRFPRFHRILGDKNTYSKSRLAIRRNIENKLGRRLVQSWTLTNEVVLVHVSGLSGIRLEPADGHLCGGAIALP